VEVVAHEEPTAQQILAQRIRLLVGELPVADFDSVKPRPIVLASFVEVERLLDRVPVHTSDARPGVKETAITRSQFGRAQEPSVGGSRDGKGAAGRDGRHSGSGWLPAAMPD
jgi:hypothetical protein